MSDLRQLYEETILDHNRRPRNFGTLDAPTHTQEGYNPLCGDHYTFYFDVDGSTVSDVRFEGSGCAISKASASVMTQLIKGRPIDEALKLFETFHSMVRGETEADPMKDGKIAVFAGVRDFPTRIKCATLAWHSMNAALSGSRDVVSTE